jgi:hypothetical protein
MAWAQKSGVLHEFNQEYRRRRLEAQRRGERFMGYAQAKARQRHANRQGGGHWRQAGGDRPGGLRTCQLESTYPWNSGQAVAFPGDSG